MIFYVAAFVGLVIVYLAARFSRFRNLAEPILTVGVAIGLIAAFVIWISDTPDRPETLPDAPAITQDQIQIDTLTIMRNQPDTSYKATGSLTNTSPATLDYFRLSATLQTCPGGTCSPVGTDEALVVLRVPPGETRPFETFFTVPNRDDVEPVDPHWTWTVTDVRGRSVD